MFKRGLIESGIAATSLCLMIGAIPCSASEQSSPPINASGAGMTNEQLLETRPVLSALKSITDSQQSVDEIKDKAKAIVSECTKTPPVNSNPEFGDSAQMVTGPYSHVEGKYYKAPKFRLLEINKEISRQLNFLAENISENRQDHRTLRASEKTREELAALRTEARSRLTQMTADAEKLTALLANDDWNQYQVTDAAKSLSRSAASVDEKLKDMEKLLKHELKNQN